MSNVGKIITNSYCNGYFGRNYDLYGAKIVAEDDDYLVIRKTNGVVEFCNFQSWDWNRNEKGEFSGGISNLKTMSEKEKQQLIDSWCQ